MKEIDLAQILTVLRLVVNNIQHFITLEENTAKRQRKILSKLVGADGSNSEFVVSSNIWH